MFVLAYYNEKKEFVESKVGSFAELRAEVEEGIAKGSKHKSAVISKIEGRRFILSELKEKPKAKSEKKDG